MSAEAVSGLVFVLSGPSGVGKDTVLEALARRGFRLGRVVTAVTRSPRPGEQDGVDYHFLTRERFLAMAEADELLEWTEYVASPRGTPLFSLRRTLAAGLDAVLKIDVDGFRKARRLLPNVISIFLAPPSFESLETRLLARHDNSTAEEQRLRLEQARLELAAIPEYDYRIVNQDGGVESAAEALAAIVTAERLRVQPRLTVLP